MPPRRAAARTRSSFGLFISTSRKPSSTTINSNKTRATVVADALAFLARFFRIGLRRRPIQRLHFAGGNTELLQNLRRGGIFFLALVAKFANQPDTHDAAHYVHKILRRHFEHQHSEQRFCGILGAN